MSNKQRIGLFGGSFDPVHVGHLIVAESVLVNLRLDLIYFIPTKYHAFKRKENITQASTRLKLLEIALKNYSCFKISKVELDREGVSYTVDTLLQFKNYEQLENIELFYIIGEDNLNELHLWKNPDQILKLSKLVVLRRPGSRETELIKKYKDKIIITDTPLIEISSSMIRQRISKNERWKSLVHPEVYNYIKKNHLYKS